MFTANPDEIWFQDLRPEAPLERKIRTFHSSQALEEILSKDYSKAKEWLKNTPVEETDPNLWDHQNTGVEKVEEALQENKTRMLVQMATGTGKTRLACALIYRLLKAGYANRVLFLVDRTNLATQAEAAFQNYNVGGGLRMGEVYKIGMLEDGALPKNAKITIATLQGMYSLIEHHDEVNLPPHLFDFIISDECHRSIYGDWRVVLNSFDATQLGLTATPATHTVSYFHRNLVHQYRYDTAVEEEHLVPYETYRIETGITAKGLYYSGEAYEPSDLERKITVPDRNRLIAKEFRENSEDGQKTLIFAVNDNHAAQLEKIFREVYSDKDDRYVKKITYTTDSPHDWLRRFQTRPYPKIAVTVDMISTGIDIKPLENLVFIRPTRSIILYNQMVGRGVRKCKEIDKEKFTIYDCIGIVEYFRGKSPFGEYIPRKPGKKVKPIEKRKPKEIIIADDVEDEIVFSGYTFSTEDGREIRPDDYAQTFEDYIRENKDEIDAIQIIMESPEDLKRKHIRELSKKLRSQSEQFTEERLQKAYKQEMVDLIGFVKHALGEESFPTTKERVEKAFNAWKQEHGFTKEELKWLELVKRHFIRNKTIKKEDFSLIPFSRHGGWHAAVEAFGGASRLNNLLGELNNQVILV
ncbi:hypothetical protein AKJ42_01770 [candidate division MSBL1 archaeon SCGC-AAA261C02]|uniref:Helicase ATP-binding domain-containing protein n=2 Tax=candidate division MSBL1 TaxID=215777 RepID=A0A133V0X7_9EURY|nr:hypothetical protein AKJ42_01770 [candidate division MSBL1 archaeon SCGC-AAA261C02]